MTVILADLLLEAEPSFRIETKKRGSPDGNPLYIFSKSKLDQLSVIDFLNPFVSYPIKDQSVYRMKPLNHS